MKLDIAKCEFFVEELEYLGYTLHRNQLRPSVPKILAIRNCPCPENVIQLKAFLGLLNAS